MERSVTYPKMAYDPYERTSEQQVKSVCSILAPIHENTRDLPNLTSEQPQKDPKQPQKDPKQPNYHLQTGDIDKQQPDSGDSSSKLNVPELLKPLNFQQVTGCTFTINLNLKQ